MSGKAWDYIGKRDEGGDPMSGHEPDPWEVEPTAYPLLEALYADLEERRLIPWRDWKATVQRARRATEITDEHAERKTNSLNGWSVWSYVKSHAAPDALLLVNENGRTHYVSGTDLLRVLAEAGMLPEVEDKR